MTVAPEAIVRALASIDTPTQFHAHYGVNQCFFCEVDDDRSEVDVDFDDLATHEPDCLWRQAKEWVAEHPEASQ